MPATGFRAPSCRVAHAAALAALALAGCRPAAAAPPCIPRADAIAMLAERFGEAPIAIGAATGALIEVLVSADGATWTILIIRPDGTACMAASGTDWQSIESREEGAL